MAPKSVLKSRARQQAEVSDHDFTRRHSFIA